MSEHLVGAVSEIGDEDRRILTVDAVEIVVFRVKDRLYALNNTCLHMGGPVGEGKILGRVESVIASDGTWLGDRFSEDSIHIVCPWHGFEYDIETGQFAGDRRLRLGRYDSSSAVGRPTSLSDSGRSTRRGHHQVAPFSAAEARQLDELLGRLLESGNTSTLSSSVTQRLLSAGCRAYADRREAEGVASPGAIDPALVTPTQAATACLGMLASVNLEIFELTLWGGALSKKY